MIIYFDKIMEEEYLNVIDEEGQIIGQEKRSECHKKNLLHRAVMVFIFNSKGKLLLQKRSMLKDLYKGYWTGSASGHLLPGENYLTAAERELKEEIGIKTPLRQSHLAKVRRETDSENVRLFIGENNGPFDLEKKEIEKVSFFSITDIKKMIKNREKFTPCFFPLFKKFLEKSKVKHD